MEAHTVPWAAPELGRASGEARLQAAWDMVLALLVHSSIWVSGAIASLALFAQHALGLPADPRAFVLLFASALFVYNLDHVADAQVRGMAPRVSTAYFRSTGLLVFLTLAALWTGVMVGGAPPAVQGVFAVYACYGLLYGVPALPWRASRTGRAARLKDMGPGKSFLTASVVVFGAVGVPLAYAGVAPDAQALQVALWLWVLCASNMHMCDVRDVLEDRHRGEHTLATRWGVRRLRHALVLLNLVVLALAAWGWSAGVVAAHPEVLVATCFTVAYVLILRTDTEPAIYDIVVDGVAYLPALLALGSHALLR